MIHDTWSGCAWILVRVCYPLTVFGWWLRHGDMFRPWTTRRFGPATVVGSTLQPLGRRHTRPRRFKTLVRARILN